MLYGCFFCLTNSDLMWTDLYIPVEVYWQQWKVSSCLNTFGLTITNINVTINSQSIVFCDCSFESNKSFASQENGGQTTKKKITDSVNRAVSNRKCECGKCPSVFKQPWPTEPVQLLSAKHFGSVSQRAQRGKTLHPSTFIIATTPWSAPNADYPRPTFPKHAGKDKNRPSANWFHLINSL